MVNLGNSLLVSNGAMWRKQRTLISPAFHFSALKPLVKLMDNCAQKMVSTLSAGESVSRHLPAIIIQEHDSCIAV